MSEPVEVTLDRIWEEARQKRRQAERIEDACKQLAVLFGVEWSPPTPENVESRCRTCGGFRAIQADIEGVSMSVRCPECSTPENVEEPT